MAKKKLRGKKHGDDFNPGFDVTISYRVSLDYDDGSNRPFPKPLLKVAEKLMDEVHDKLDAAAFEYAKKQSKKKA